jgi:predicted flap endonuclease-1-like 5' DNA nuclease
VEEAQEAEGATGELDAGILEGEVAPSSFSAVEATQAQVATTELDTELEDDDGYPSTFSAEEATQAQPATRELDRETEEDDTAPSAFSVEEAQEAEGATGELDAGILEDEVAPSAFSAVEATQAQPATRELDRETEEDDVAPSAFSAEEAREETGATDALDAGTLEEEATPSTFSAEEATQAQAATRELDGEAEKDDVAPSTFSAQEAIQALAATYELETVTEDEITPPAFSTEEAEQIRPATHELETGDREQGAPPTFSVQEAIDALIATYGLASETETEEEEGTLPAPSTQEAIEALIASYELPSDDRDAPLDADDARPWDDVPSETQAPAAVVELDLAAPSEEEEKTPSAFSAQEAIEALFAADELEPDDRDDPLDANGAGLWDDEPERDFGVSPVSAFVQAADKAQAEAVSLTDQPVEAEAQDLTRIKGIGPKIAETLNKAGIVTYDQLAATPAGRLEEILQAAGPSYRMANPSAWPKQARLAAGRKWNELRSLQDRLTSGAVVFPAAAQAQDLTRIEGIGPEIAEMLNKAGIVNYEQLAATPVGRLVDLLDAAGPRYVTANPSTWPQQARLAAGEKWDELKTLQDRLSGN